MGTMNFIDTVGGFDATDRAVVSGVTLPQERAIGVVRIAPASNSVPGTSLP